MAVQTRSAALRQEIESSLASRIPAALSPQAAQAPRLLPLANEAVNALLGGGLPIGGICELTGPATAGRTSLALSVLSEATVDAACAYVDVSDSLDGRSAAAAGVRLQNLLWIRFAEEQEPRAGQPQVHAVPARTQCAHRTLLWLLVNISIEIRGFHLLPLAPGGRFLGLNLTACFVAVAKKSRTKICPVTSFASHSAHAIAHTTPAAPTLAQLESALHRGT